MEKEEITPSETTAENTSITPTPVTGIFTDGSTTMQPSPAIVKQQKSSKNKIVVIIIAIILAIALAVGGFFLYRHFSNAPKTIAEFEKIMTSIGYTKASNFSYSGADGAFTAYTTGSSTSADGIAIFYEMPSKDKLKQSVEEISSEFKESFIKFDWSKDYNKLFECNTNNKQVHICMGVVHKSNTLLAVLYHSNSAETARTEAEKIINAMGYQQ